MRPAPLKFTVLGPPRTKKNSGRLVQDGHGRRRLLPSRAWESWARSAMIVTPAGELVAGSILPRTAAYNVRATFYRDRNGPGDAVGYYQGLADLLEKRGIVANDRQLVSWDGTRITLDRDRPRVEVRLEEVA